MKEYTIANFQSYCFKLALMIFQERDTSREYTDADELLDALIDNVHETVDCLEDVIYYHNAWNVVDMFWRNKSSDLDAAQEELHDMGCEFESLEKYKTQLSYQLFYNEVRFALENICRDFVESVEAA